MDSFQCIVLTRHNTRRCDATLCSCVVLS